MTGIQESLSRVGVMTHGEGTLECSLNKWTGYYYVKNEEVYPNKGDCSCNRLCESGQCGPFNHSQWQSGWGPLEGTAWV